MSPFTARCSPSHFAFCQQASLATRSLFLAALVSLLSLCPSLTSAQILGPAPQVLGPAIKTDIVTATADSLVAGERNGLPVEQLVGHVQFAQGSLYGTADRAIRYKSDQNRIELIGNVAIHQDTLSLYAPIVSYNGLTHTGHAENGVKLLDRDVTLTARTGDYDMDNQVAYFHDHVTINQGTSVSHSDDLTYYRSTQTSILTGRVTVRSDSGTLRANKVTYSRALDETTAEGAVQLANDSVRLVSDWFYNSKPLGEMYTRGHVSVEDLKNHTVLYGDTIARFVNRGYSVVPRNPLLLSIDSSIVTDSATGQPRTVFDTMFIKAKLMETYQGDSARFIATDSVRLLRSTLSGIGGKLYYDQKQDLVTFSQLSRQRLWSDSTEIDADSVALRLKDNHVSRAYAVGHAFTTSPVEGFAKEGRVDQLQGERMTLVIEHDTVRQLFDMGSALSIYFRVTENKADGVNRASGDTIRIDFQKKAVSRLAVISGTEGEYFPERFVKGRAQLFRLSQYERNLELRPRRGEFVIPWLLPDKPVNLLNSDPISKRPSKKKGNS